MTTSPPIPPAAATTTSPAGLKEKFVKTAGTGGKKVLPAVRARVNKCSDSTATCIKIMLFGPYQTGKTFMVYGLLRHGFKVLVLTTDVGGDGLLGIKLALRREGRAELLDNLFEISLSGYDEITSFLKEPANFWPEIYDEGIDFLFWDGFHGFQQVDLSEHIGDMTPARAEGSKEVSDARSSGLQFEQADWGMMRNGTVRALDHYCALHNKKTGQVWHKIVTCQEAIKSRGNGKGGFEEAKMPLLQGAGGIMSGGAFDLIIKCAVKRKKKAEGAEADEFDDGREYFYITSGHENLMAKNRGFKLLDVMPADPVALWAEIEKQAGLVRKATDALLVRPVDVTVPELPEPAPPVA